MELQFTKDNHGMWVSEFEARAVFNLHIERTKGGIISLYQRTSGGGWAEVDEFEAVRHQAAIDFDCTALIYPKWCKIESEVEPSYAEVVSNGEITEIKSQSKEVEITANGVTEIAPDNGFGYLSGVKVNVNVPTGGGSEGEGSSWRYFDSKSLPSSPLNEMSFIGLIAGFFQSVKVDNLGVVTIGGTGLIANYGTAKENWGYYIAFAVDMNSKIFLNNGMLTVEEYFKLQISGEYNVEQFLAAIGFKEITEEEFYNTEA